MCVDWFEYFVEIFVHDLTINFIHVNKINTLGSRAMVFVIGVACLVLAFFIFDAIPVFAQVTDELGTVQETSGLSDQELPVIIGNIIRIFLSVLGVIFLGLVLNAGYIWMTAGGDGDKVQKAKNILINATIGLAITLSAYAITSFIINALTGALSGASSSSSYSSMVSVERLSGSLGSGGIQDHYPARNATEISRNTNVFVTFKDAIDPGEIIDGYDIAGTPYDASDDTIATELNTSNVVFYPTAQGEGSAVDVEVSVTDDFKTFVFSPVALLGSSIDDTSYTFYLDDSIENIDAETILASGGYEWSFEVGTEIDLTAPTVVSVTPAASGTYDRNIVVEVTFDEAVDPTSASGARLSDSGFDNIQTVADSIGAPTAGDYVISNQYRTITFTSSEACGINSCGETIYCLEGSDTINVTVVAASVGSDAPQTDVYPYDGIVDTSGNALDGDGDGEAGDDYSWGFSTTDDINLDAPVILNITPNISESDVALDQEVYITFDSVMMSSTLTSSNISLTPLVTHEMSYWISVNSLDEDGADAVESGRGVAASQVEIGHGVFLESVEGGTLYSYAVEVPVMDGTGDAQILNQYQNCFMPGAGPDSTGGSCAVSDSEPYCCSGEPSAAECF